MTFQLSSCLPFECYSYNFNDVVSTELSKDERGPIVKQIILEKLPEDNYAVLKYLVHFLSKVHSYIKLAFVDFITDTKNIGC